MSHIDLNSFLEALAAAITALGGGYTLIRSLWSRHKANKGAYRQEILKEAKEEAEKFKSGLEAKIKDLEVEFKARQDDLEKDLINTKTIYNSEIKLLGQRIQELRQDIQVQHTSLVNLLTKLVNSK